jgi:hypothetical protein
VIGSSGAPARAPLAMPLTMVRSATSRVSNHEVAVTGAVAMVRAIRKMRWPSISRAEY